MDQRTPQVRDRFIYRWGKVLNQDSAARSDPTVPIKITHVRGFESEAENGLTQ